MGLLDFLSIGNKRVDALPAYTAIVQQARLPALYGTRGAPDSFDGRFDMLALHVHFVLRRVRADGSARTEFGQELFDLFFRDMDQAMREAGVGDLGVGKKIRKMAQAFYGRVHAYDEAIGKAAPAQADAANIKALAEVLGRNLFPDNDTPPAAPIEALATYALRLEAYLQDCTTEDIMAGRALPAAQVLEG